MPNNQDNNEKGICCSFCGKPQNFAKRLIAGPGVYICSECVHASRRNCNESAAQCF